MKIKQLCVTALLCTGFSLNLFAEDKKMVSSELKEATVFFSGAELTHTATTVLQKGDNEIHVSGLSPYVDVNSIKIKTNKGAVVSAFEFMTDNVKDKSVESDSIEIEKRKATINTYQQELNLITTRNKINNDLLSVMQKSVIKNVEGSEKGLGIDDLMKTLDYFKSKSLETHEQILVDTERQKELTYQMSKLQGKISEMNSKASKITGIVKLNLAALDAGNSQITISYFTHAANWVPFYDISVASTDKPIKITSKAKVRQSSGLDWTKVKLALTTAVPSSGKTAPLFNVWYLRYYQPLQVILNDERMMMQNSFSYDKEESVSSESKMRKKSAPSMNDFVVHTENQINTTFNINILYSIPSNGKEINIELKNEEVPAEFKYYCAPRLDAETYVLAEIKNWQKLNLMTAKANVTYDGTYVGETMIDAGSTKETLALTLGSDKRVPVKRETEHEYSSSRMLGGSILQTFTYKMTVRNNQNVPIKMVLKDQYPQSATKEMSAEFLSKETTTPTFHVEELGVVTWEFDLKPGEVREFKMAYNVKYPKDKKPMLY